MRNSFKIFQSCLVFFFALTGMALAQTEKSPTPIQASVGEVTDNRTTGLFNAECKLELKFTGDAAADAVKVRQVNIIEAKDELGRDLILKQDDNFTSSFNSARSGNSVKYELRLRNPSRNATTIKLLKGEVELFSPTEANGGLLTIKNVLQHPAEAIANPELAKYGIQLMYLTKETYEAKKKELEAQQKSGTGGGQFGEAFSGMFSGMSGGMGGNSKNAIQMYVKDPKKAVISLKFADGAGKPLKNRGSWSGNDFHSTSFDAPPPPDTQLVLELATDESVKSFPFKLENIPLP